MRLGLTIMIFLVVSVTVAGLAIAALLTAPFSEREVRDLFVWIAGGGFVVALIASYFIAGHILKNFSGSGQKS